MDILTAVAILVVGMAVTAPLWLQPLLCRVSLENTRKRIGEFERVYKTETNRPLEQAREAFSRAEEALRRQAYDTAYRHISQAERYLNNAYEVWRFRNHPRTTA